MRGRYLPVISAQSDLLRPKPQVSRFSDSTWHSPVFGYGSRDFGDES